MINNGEKLYGKPSTANVSDLITSIHSAFHLILFDIIFIGYKSAGFVYISICIRTGCHLIFDQQSCYSVWCKESNNDCVYTAI